MWRRWVILPGMMEFDGYMIHVWWDGQTLTVRPNNGVARAALFGPNRDAEQLVLPRVGIASVQLKDASALTNGNLIVTTTNGQKYQLHFRRKHRADFARLADALQ